MPEALIDPVSSFLIPPLGFVTFNTHNKGTLQSGFARVFASADVEVESRYLHPAYTTSAEPGWSGIGRSVSMAARVSGSQNTGIAIVPFGTENIHLSLRDHDNNLIASRTLAVTANQQVVGFVTDFLPTVTQTELIYGWPLQITALASGELSVVALHFNDGTIAPVPVPYLICPPIIPPITRYPQCSPPWE
jgi:hypothetical protein